MDYFSKGKSKMLAPMEPSGPNKMHNVFGTNRDPSIIFSESNENGPK